MIVGVVVLVLRVGVVLVVLVDLWVGVVVFALRVGVMLVVIVIDHWGILSGSGVRVCVGLEKSVCNGVSGGGVGGWGRVW